MNVPGFNAESSLGPARGVYQGKAVFGGSGMGAVFLQQFGASSVLGRFGDTRRCCGFSTLFHRFVCINFLVHPIEQCECGQDFFGHPIISCRSPVFSLD